MTEPTTDAMSPAEQAQADAEAFVTAQIKAEADALHEAIARDSKLEKEVAKKHTKLDAAYWKLARANLDGEPTEKEKEAQHLADQALKQLHGVSLALSQNREKLKRLDLDFTRRVRIKREQLERSRNGNGNGHDEGGRMSKEATKRVPVPQATVDRVVELVKTKSQQEVADLLNKEGKTTASGKPWTPQNIWHLVKKATGKGVPRKAARTNGGAARKTGAAKKTTAARKKTASAKKTTSAKRKSGPISKASQASGTSRGGSGSKKKKTTASRRGR